jgi:hypothetical protein
VPPPRLIELLREAGLLRRVPAGGLVHVVHGAEPARPGCDIRR